MESGLEDRNNDERIVAMKFDNKVSMESGLEDRNNSSRCRSAGGCRHGLNGVRPRRPEQSSGAEFPDWWPNQVSMESGLEDRNNLKRAISKAYEKIKVSMESGLEDRNNLPLRRRSWRGVLLTVSMESGLEDRNNVR